MPADWYKLTLEQWREIRHALGNQRLLGMELASGGHLSHGYRLNVSGKMFEAHGYTVDRSSNFCSITPRSNAWRHRPETADPAGGLHAYPRQHQLRADARVADRAERP